MGIQFRKLDPSEARVLFIRHEEHEGQVLLPECHQALVGRGKTLAAAGIKIDGGIKSSPQLRCVRTACAVAEGAGQTPRLYTDDGLTDISSEKGLDKNQLKAEAKAAGVEAEVYLLAGEAFSERMDRRGDEGARAIRDLVHKMEGTTALASSHGGSRMEVTLLALLGQNNAENRKAVAEGRHGRVRIVDRGQIVELIFDEMDGLVEVNYIANADFDLGLDL